MSKPKLSIVISAYNVQDFINKCVTSCINQNIEISLYEIIVIDDGSSDSTVSIVKDLQKNNLNLKLFSQKNNGLGSTRNYGIDVATGKYIWFIDGDDYIKENILKNIINMLEKNNLDILSLNYAIVDTKGCTIGKKDVIFTIKSPIVSGASFYKTNFEISYTPIFIFNLKLFEDNSIRFKEKINMQDSEILPKILKNVKRLSTSNDISYFYVQHENSFTNTKNGQKRFNYFKSIIEVKTSLEEQLENNTDKDLKVGIKNKLNSLHKIVFNHLIFYKYEKEWLSKTIQLLNDNNLYPVKTKPKIKLLPILWGLNTFPSMTKYIIDNILLRNK